MCVFRSMYVFLSRVNSSCTWCFVQLMTACTPLFVECLYVVVYEYASLCCGCLFLCGVCVCVGAWVCLCASMCLLCEVASVLSYPRPCPFVLRHFVACNKTRKHKTSNHKHYQHL